MTVAQIFNSNICLDMKMNMPKKHAYMCQILKIQYLPGELGLAFTTAISSLLIFGEGKKHRTKPIEKISKRSRPHKWIET